MSPKIAVVLGVLVRGRQWAAFGHIGAEVELARVPGHNVAQ
jgi:hypothetical protein